MTLTSALFDSFLLHKYSSEHWEEDSFCCPLLSFIIIPFSSAESLFTPFHGSPDARHSVLLLLFHFPFFREIIVTAGSLYTRREKLLPFNDFVFELMLDKERRERERRKMTVTRAAKGSKSKTKREGEQISDDFISSLLLAFCCATRTISSDSLLHSSSSGSHWGGGLPPYLLPVVHHLMLCCSFLRTGMRDDVVVVLYSFSCPQDALCNHYLHLIMHALLSFPLIMGIINFHSCHHTQ